MSAMVPCSSIRITSSRPSSSTSISSCSSASPPQEQVQALRRHAGSRPSRSHRLQLGNAKACLLHGLAPGADLGLILIEQACDGLQEIRVAFHMHHGRAELPDQDDRASHRIVGEQSSGVGAVQDLPRHGPAIRHLDREFQKLAPALMEGFDLLNPVACHVPVLSRWMMPKLKTTRETLKLSLEFD
jgi:hypothetical protein